MSANPCCEETPCQWGDHPCERKKPMSDTPRTDHFVSIRKWEDGQEPLDAWARFARQLERELKRLDEGLNRACDRITDLQRPAAAMGITMKFETHCPDGQMCGATTTGCLEGQCQRKDAELSTCQNWCQVHGQRA